MLITSWNSRVNLTETASYESVSLCPGINFIYLVIKVLMLILWTKMKQTSWILLTLPNLSKEQLFLL